ncbi:MAG: single-stranded-DNA-specific exonuclease RecJ [Actinomycetota bacterium]
MSAPGDTRELIPSAPPWRASRVAYADVRRLERQLGCSEPMAWVLVRRGLADPDAARAFLSADGELADPLAIDGIAEAAQRLRDAITAGEHVAIHGDYDCDGVCSTAILAQALRARGATVTTFLPSRFTDGYGVSDATVERLAEGGARVLVCVDCGTSNVEALTRATELGMDVVVLDHHLAAGARPPGIIANPALGRGMHALPAAAGVVFDVVRVLAQGDQGLLGGDPEEGVDLAGLATVADSMPLVDGNRRLVHRALHSIRRGERPGIVALLAAAGQGYRGITPRGLSFTLAPAINAAGRLDEASRALDLMIETDPARAREMADELWALNSRRREVERQVTAEAIATVEAAGDLQPVTVVAGEGWHEGVVGIVASRLVERFGRPAIVLSTDGADAKGSGRSLPGLDLHAIVADASDPLTRWGGHSGAVGVSLAADDIPAFRDALAASAAGRSADIARARTREVDAVVAGADLTLANAEELEALAPFGRGNPEPRIVVPGCAVSGVSRVGEGRHLKARLSAGGVGVPAIGFSMGRRADGLAGDGEDARYDAVAKLEVERWQDTMGPRVSLDDLALLPAGPAVGGHCADACDVACGLRVPSAVIGDMVAQPFGAPAPVRGVQAPVEVRDRRGEGRGLSLICALAGADRGVAAVVADVPRRRAALGDVLYPGRLGVDVAVLGGDRCDPEAMRGRLALARGGPVLALLDYAALAEVPLPPDVHLVAIDPPMTASQVDWLRVAGAGRTAHLSWGPEEADLALRVALADLAVRDVARSLWPGLAAHPGGLAWGAECDAVLAGDGPVARSPRSVAIALAALADAGLVRVGDAGLVVVPGAPQADLEAGAVGRRAAALADEAQVMAARAMTMDVLGSIPEWLPEPTGALS